MNFAPLDDTGRGDTPDERFAELLAQYDEALAEETPLAAVFGPGLQPSDERLAGAQRCLRLLARRWPREQPRLAASPAIVRLDSLRLPARLGRFELRRELGRGGFGVVFLAHDPVLMRDVALKLPRPEMLSGSEGHRRFVREGQTAARLHHPHLVTVLEAGEIGLVCYLVSEYCPGSTLAAWCIRHATPVVPQDAAQHVLALADAVGYMHDQGVLHRDLKPSNVLLTVRGETVVPDNGDARLAAWHPKLTDFGLVKSARGDTLATRSGTPLGTPAYMAPEQARGQSQEIGAATDVYSLGVILYELLAGKNPFAGDNDIDTLMRQTDLEPAPLRRWRRDVPRDLEAICQKCLEKQPSRRYANGRQLADDLRRFLLGEATKARPLSLVEQLSRFYRRRPVAVGAAGVSLAGVIVALLARLVQRRAGEGQLRARRGTHESH